MTNASVFLLAWVAMMITGCGNGARREAGSLGMAVERWRRAEMGQKAAESGAILAAVCTDAEVCEAKRVCVLMIQPTGEGLALKAEVEHAMADLEAKRLTPDSDAGRALADKLDDASRLLEKGRAALPLCDEKILALRLKYGI